MTTRQGVAFTIALICLAMPAVSGHAAKSKSAWLKKLKPGEKTAAADSAGMGLERRGEILIVTLDNGLRAVIQENPAAPVVAMAVWVKVGSGDETDLEAGIAHLHEHMLFKGTERRGVGQISQEVEAAGGDINAFTSGDQTVYHLVMASRYFETGLDILADAVRHSSFDPGELAKEEEVVLEELRRSEDDPRDKIYRYLFETSFQVHPYRRPIIGYKETVSSFTRDQIVGFYRRWYVPENLTVVVVGDVKAEIAAAKVKEMFGSMPTAPDPRAGGSTRDAKEPLQSGARVSIHPSPISETYLYLGFHTPAFAQEDMAELDLLSVILGMGESSRLVQRVRSEKQLVNKIWSYSYTPQDPGLFLVGAELAAVKGPEALSEILRQTYLLKHQPVEPWELDKAKLQIESEADYSRETVQGQARKLGFFITLTGDPTYEERYLQRVSAVTAEDLMRAARKYLSSSNLTIAAMAPEKDAKSFNPAKADAALHRVDQEEIEGKSASWAEVEPEPAPIMPPAAASVSAPDQGPKEPVRFQLRNGVRLLIKERHDVPLVAVRAAFLGGVRSETRANNGINNFIAQAVTEGTDTRTAQQIHSQIESMAASLDGFSGRNSLGVTLETLSKYFDPALELMADVIRHPAFPREEMDKARLIILSNLRTQKDLPQQVAMNGFRAALYPNHPYGMKVLGTEEVVQKLTPQDLKDYYQRIARPADLVITVVGDVEAKAVKKRIEDLFGDWTGRTEPGPKPLRDAPPKEVRKVVECMNRKQANLALGFQGATLDGPDRYTLAVLNGVLSTMGGRLFLILRDQQSLAYSVYSFHEEGLDPGFLGVYIGTAPEKEETALKGILAELERIRTEPVGPEELERAKKSLIGGFEIDLQRNANQASHLLFDELYGLGFRDSERFAERIQAVTAEQVLQAAKTYFRLEAYVLSTVKPCP